MLKNKLSKYVIAGSMALVGLAAGVATMAGAQSTATKVAPVNTVVQSQVVDTPEPGDVADNTNQAVDTPEAGDVADNATSTDVTEMSSTTGHHNESADKANDSDGSATKEAGESASSTDSGE